MYNKVVARHNQSLTSKPICITCGFLIPNESLTEIGHWQDSIVPTASENCWTFLIKWLKQAYCCLMKKHVAANTTWNFFFSKLK